jgi:hypothetical protein
LRNKHLDRRGELQIGPADDRPVGRRYRRRVGRVGIVELTD